MHSATGWASSDSADRSCRCQIADPMPWDMSKLNPDTVTKAACLVAELKGRPSMKVAPFVGDTEIHPGQVLIFAIIAPEDDDSTQAVVTSTIIDIPTDVAEDKDDRAKLWWALATMGDAARTKA